MFLKMYDILLNPGPTNTSIATKIHQWINSDKCHREEEFLDSLTEIKQQLLKEVYLKNKGAAALIAGSGTTAIESMVCSLIENNIHVINAGDYGNRATKIMDAFNIDYTEIKSNNVGDLKGSEEITHLYFVENETTTGEKYSLKDMAKLYPNAKFYIDATSSFGASSYIEYSEKIAAICFCSNKCLQSTPGIGIVLWDKNELIKNRGYFCNLQNYKDSPLPFTLPTQSIGALKHIVSKQINKKELFDKRKDAIIFGLKSMGIECINKYPCNSIIGFKHPNKTYKQLKDFLLKRNIIIYSGINGIQNSFRVSTMSVLFDKKIDYILKAFHDSCLP